MIKTTAKGYRSEQKTKEYFEKLGFIVQNTIRSSHRGSNDFFGLWDHIAIVNETNDIEIINLQDVRVWYANKEEILNYKGDTIYLQTKSNSMRGVTKNKKYIDFPAKNKFVVVWKDNVKEPQIKRIPNG